MRGESEKTKRNITDGQGNGKQIGCRRPQSFLTGGKGTASTGLQHFTDTYNKHDGRWLIWADESTRMP